MILSDRDIRTALQRLEDPLIVDPGFDPARLQPASLELTLDSYILVEEKPYLVRNAAGESIVRYPDQQFYDHTMNEQGFLLHNNQFVLASTVEKVHIPRDLVAQVNGKSSHGRRGLVVHQTAGFIDPGFRGTVTLELSNASSWPIRITPGMPICQLVFFQMTSPSERPYGSKGLGSHYQGQAGATASAA